MSKISEMKSYRAVDGTTWGVDAKLPGASNALIIFHHPDGRSARKDRYAWLNWHGVEAERVNTRIDLDKVRGALDEGTIRELFTRSMIVDAGKGPAFSPA